MKVIIGLVLLAGAILAHPLPEESKEGLPLVIADYSSVTKSEEQHHLHHHDSVETGSSSEESSERPLEPIPSSTELAKPIINEEKLIPLTTSEELNKQERPLADELPLKPTSETPLLPSSSLAPVAVPLPLPITPKLEEKREEKKDEPKPILEEIKTEEKLVPEIKKIEESLPVPQALPAVIAEAKKDEFIVPAVKSIIEGAAELKATSALNEEVLPVPVEAPEKIEEKPLALPTLKAEEIKPAKEEEKLPVPAKPLNPEELKPELKPEAPIALPSAEPEKKAEALLEEKSEKKAKADEVVPVAAATTEAAKLEASTTVAAPLSSTSS